MILVDSFGWIEFFADGPLADKYFGYLKDESKVITPTIVLYEVYKKIKRERSEEEALVAVAQINKTKVLPLDELIALSAADLSLKYALPMADAVVYATACSRNAKVVTSDPHFERLPGVTFLKV
ncbi:MAG TPA: VapC toxin family PIN domain ribonuclease [Actinobacteria bacterium]|nr:VapC toxin family PIN domain ribonuclease [Actinomycetota bacterium]